MSDPTTGLITGGLAIASKDVMAKLLGPSADYIGGGMRDLQAYARLDLYEASDLRGEFEWLRGVSHHGEQLVYAVMPSKLSGNLAHYSRLPRFGGHPYGVIVCESLAYERESSPRYG